jgi:hypothetical protein
MKPHSGPSNQEPTSTEPAKRSRFSQALRRLRRETKRPELSKSSIPIAMTKPTYPPIPTSLASAPPISSELARPVAELQIACKKLEGVMESLHEFRLWKEETIISLMRLETVDELCKWLTAAARKKDQVAPPEQAQTLREQILDSMSHGIKATAQFITPTLKVVLGIGKGLSAVFRF